MTMRSMEERMIQQASVERALLHEQMTQLSQQVQSLTTVVHQHISQQQQQQQLFQHQLPEIIRTIVQEQVRQQLQLSLDRLRPTENDNGHDNEGDNDDDDEIKVED